MFDHRHLSVDSVTNTQTIIFYCMAILIIIAFLLINFLASLINQLQRKVMGLLQRELHRVINDPEQLARLCTEIEAEVRERNDPDR